MSETPLIREAADGNARNVKLLLEAGADVEAQQQNSMGFNAINDFDTTGLLSSCIFNLPIVWLNAMGALI